MQAPFWRVQNSPAEWWQTSASHGDAENVNLYKDCKDSIIKFLWHFYPGAYDRTWRHRCTTLIILPRGKKEITVRKFVSPIITTEKVLINELFSVDGQLSGALFLWFINQILLENKLTSESCSKIWELFFLRYILAKSVQCLMHTSYLYFFITNKSFNASNNFVADRQELN